MEHDSASLKFCPCPNKACEHHFHRSELEGCTKCVEKCRRENEIPACFWFLVSDDFEGVKDWTISSYVEFVRKHRPAS
jgi:hypothetical protein